MKIAIYPGSFDPITNGHMDIIDRASRLFDKVYVCVATNINKTCFFSGAERTEMIREATKPFRNVEVMATDDLIVHVAKRLHATAIVRGLRAVTDFEYEFQLAAANEYLDREIETVFLMASSGKGFISSSSIKEFWMHEVDISSLVPDVVVEQFKKKSREQK